MPSYTNMAAVEMAIVPLPPSPSKSISNGYVLEQLGIGNSSLSLGNEEIGYGSNL